MYKLLIVAHIDCESSNGVWNEFVQTFVTLVSKQSNFRFNIFIACAKVRPIVSCFQFTT